MAHWDDVLPLPILKLPYEELAGDSKGKSMELISYIGLDWDDACLNSHSSPGAVGTASKCQVREPVYSSAIGLWKPYKDYLAPFVEAIDDV